jgi:hypothetical protein
MIIAFLHEYDNSASGPSVALGKGQGARGQNVIQAYFGRFRNRLVIFEIGADRQQRFGHAEPISFTGALSMHVNQPTDLIGIAISHAHIIFAFDFGRYLIAASLIAGLVWLLRRSSIGARKIQAREATLTDVRREVLASVQTCLVYVAVGIFVAWGIRNGVLLRHEDSVSWGVDLATLAAMIAVHDAYFYWSHRAMHHPKLFKVFHRHHHANAVCGLCLCRSRSVCDGHFHADLAGDCADIGLGDCRVPQCHDCPQRDGACRV